MLQMVYLVHKQIAMLVDLGTTGVRWKDLYVDNIQVTNDIVVADDIRMDSDSAAINFGIEV